jgi:hypothetical protein
VASAAPCLSLGRADHREELRRQQHHQKRHEAEAPTLASAGLMAATRPSQADRRCLRHPDAVAARLTGTWKDATHGIHQGRKADHRVIGWGDVAACLAAAGGFAVALRVGSQLRGEQQDLAQQERTDDPQESPRGS